MAIKVEPRSVGVLRAQARAPRLMLMLSAAVLSAVGARSLIAPRPLPTQRPTGVTQAVDFGAHFAAENAARALVRGTASEVVGDESRGSGRRLITVAVTAPEQTYVAVLVARDAEGRVVVYQPSAIVGPPPSRLSVTRDGSREVADAGLVRVVRRVLGNYLRGERDDVVADLAVGARVSVPATRIRPRPVDTVTWLVPGRRVAVLLSARLANGDLVELRYELGVVRAGGRWLVSQIHVDPVHQEVRP